MFIKRLTLKKLLSFNDCTVELGPLNVLIGPNAVGKSNLIEAIGLLQSLPTNLIGAFLSGGGVRQWLWLGDTVPVPIATVECEIWLPPGRHSGKYGYQLRFSEDAPGLVILSEKLTNCDRFGVDTGSTQERYFVREGNVVRFETGTEAGIPAAEAVLALFKSPLDATPVTEIGRNLASQIRIFREFKTGPRSAARWGVSTNAAKDALTDGSDNLAMVLLELDFLGVHDRIRDYLKRFCERFEDVKVGVGEGLARLSLREAGLSEMLSAIRMSDGTLKFLSLLAALFHPKPPLLMCIEEPEVGLHPDALQLVAEALSEASQSMQLVVTTHSEALVDALSDQPEAVLVCERDFDNGTQFQRLSKEKLQEWLEHYTLGQLWRKGEIGGGRW
jgi:predicted ATPase